MSLRPRAWQYCHDKNLECLIQSRVIRYIVPMCFASLNRPSQTSHKDGKAHFENNISHKDHCSSLA